MNKLIVIVVALLLAVLLVAFLMKTGDAEEPVAATATPATEAAPPVYVDQPHQGLTTVHCALEVNGARYRTLGSGVPLYVKCIVTNPLADSSLDLIGAERLRPLLRSQQGTVVDPGLELITPTPQTVPPSGVSVLTWVLTETLPPGEYDIDMEPPTHLAECAPGIDKVRVKPALLRITEDPATAAEIAYYTRQIMAARGENEQILELLRSELEQSPESLALRRELVDTLERTGDFPAARGELIQLGLLAQERQQGGNEDAPLHLPAWIITRDRMLQERIAAEQ